jgi:RHS repeat-associated protein
MFQRRAEVKYQSVKLHPFGSCISNRGFSSAAYRFGFNNQEKDGELGDSYAFEYRIHYARLGRFLSVDPLFCDYPWNSSYTFAENDNIRAIDLEGAERLIVIGFMGYSSTRLKAASQSEKNSAILGFTLTHPIAAYEIGDVEFGGKNISSISSRIARHASENNNLTVLDGGERNAFRHALWSASIANQFGVEVAEKAGLAHEGIKVAESFLIDFDQPLVQDILVADEICDILNNSLSRSIGSKLPKGTSQIEIAKAVLKTYRDEGFYETVRVNNTLKIVKNKITEAQYQKALTQISGLDNNGMNEKDRKEVEEKD